ncbi:hypothetical protein JDS87_30215 [Bacillus cereus]|uniref:alpha/beta hydrolase-fold protein n=1 Tax=Bacillus cereus TaxID=1396 RepID=UPI0018F5B878|nr:alpha/beta hydrolase-fold protein [Bacillus cereus]MBJ8056025.1 hypothetical protein [Bacillus cereus]
MIEKFTVNISALSRERLIRVCLPKRYENSNKNYPVLYMHDGQNLYRDEDSFFGSSWRIADCLEESGLELIVVGVLVQKLQDNCN